VAVVSILPAHREQVEAYAALARPLGIDIALFDDIAEAERWLDAVQP
jgi:hypothetical protein